MTKRQPHHSNLSPLVRRLESHNHVSLAYPRTRVKTQTSYLRTCEKKKRGKKEAHCEYKSTLAVFLKSILPKEAL